MSELLPRRVAAACLVAGTLLFAVSDLLRRLVDPDNEADPVTALGLVHDHRATWAFAGALAILCPFLLLAGLGALLPLVPGRGRVLTRVGVILFGGGVIASLAHATGEFGQPAVRERANLSGAAVKQLDGAGFWPWDLTVVVFILGFTAGLLVFFVGLRRACIVPIWAVVAALVAVVCGSTTGVPAGIVGVVAWLTAFLPVAVAVASTADVDLGHLTAPGWPPAPCDRCRSR